MDSRVLVGTQSRTDRKRGAAGRRAVSHAHVRVVEVGRRRRSSDPWRRSLVAIAQGQACADPGIGRARVVARTTLRSPELFQM